jgi:hypothetical protein
MKPFLDFECIYQEWVTREHNRKEETRVYEGTELGPGSDPMPLAQP